MSVLPDQLLVRTSMTHLAAFIASATGNALVKATLERASALSEPVPGAGRSGG